MIRNFKVIFCGNEHGTGDVSFPDLARISKADLSEECIKEATIRELRKRAKVEGWGFVNGEDYCPTCMENGI